MLMTELYGNWPDNYFAVTPPGWTGNQFFALSGNPIASAQYPVAARVFLASQNTLATQQITLQANRTDLLQSDPKLVTGQFFGANRYASWQALVHSIRTSYGDAPSSRIAYAGDGPATIVSDQEDLTYDRSDVSKPIYQVNSPDLQSITGFIAGRLVDMPYNSVAVSPSTAAFASITLQLINNQPLLALRRSLLPVLTRYENTGMSWNADRTSLGTQWGTAPSLNVMRGPNSLGNGIPVQQWSFWGGTNQIWKLVPGSDSYQLISGTSGLCLDVVGGPAATGISVRIQQ